MTVAAPSWTFKKLRATQEDAEGASGSTTGGAAVAAQAGTPAWVWVGLGMMAAFLVVSSLGLAASLGAFAASPQPPSPPPPFPPPSPPPPYTSDDATQQCNNDCGSCGANGGCTYSYGNGGAQHDGRSYTSNGECDDGGPDSVHSFCDLGSDCTDCGPRVIS